jgi:hypothetical protein
MVLSASEASMKTDINWDSCLKHVEGLGGEVAVRAHRFCRENKAWHALVEVENYPPRIWLEFKMQTWDGRRASTIDTEGREFAIYLKPEEREVPAQFVASLADDIGLKAVAPKGHNNNTSPNLFYILKPDYEDFLEAIND